MRRLKSSPVGGATGLVLAPPFPAQQMFVLGMLLKGCHRNKFALPLEN